MGNCRFDGGRGWTSGIKSSRRDIGWTVLVAALKNEAANGFFEIIGIIRVVIGFMRLNTDGIVKVGTGVVGRV